MAIQSWQEFSTQKNIPLNFKSGTAVTVGVFDGVHRGHQALVSKILAKSKSAGYEPLLFTFTEHPRGILHPEKKWLTLTPLEKKIAILQELGISNIVCIDFSKNFSIIKGSDFLSALINLGGMRYMAIGYDFRCGFENAYDAEKIAAFNMENGIETEIIGPVLDNGEPVSSSRIRAAILANNSTEAERLLGRKN